MKNINAMNERINKYYTTNLFSDFELMELICLPYHKIDFTCEDLEGNKLPTSMH